LTGSEALKIGLVDKIGGLNDAIANAKLAKIKTYSTQNYPEYEKNFEDLFTGFRHQSCFIKEEIGEKLPCDAGN
jgi:protease-4